MKGKNGSYEITGNKGITARITWSETYDSSGKSVLSVDNLEIKGKNWYGIDYFLNGTIKVNGTNIVEFSSALGSHAVHISALGVYAGVTTHPDYDPMPWESGQIAHSATGEATADIAVDIKGFTVSGGAGNGWHVTGTQRISLTTIKLASVPTVSPGTVYLGQQVTINTNRSSDSYTHTLTYSFGALSGEIAKNVASQATWTVPLSIAASIPAATSGSITIWCVTYQSGAQVGDPQPAELPFSVPDNTETRPRVTMTITPSPAGAVLQGRSRLQVTVSASSAYSSVASASVVIDGKRYPGSSVTSDVLQSAGDIRVTAEAVDARGYSGSAESTIKVLRYAIPTLAPYPGDRQVWCLRSDSAGNDTDGGTYLHIRCSRRYSPVPGNKCQIDVAVSKSGQPYGPWSTVQSPAEPNNVNKVIGGLVTDPTATYSVRLRVYDTIGSENVYTFETPSEATDFHLREGGNGAAFGKYAEEPNTLDVAWKIHARQPLLLEAGFVEAPAALLSAEETPAWAFPPSQEGVEYRTMAHFFGYPVYTMDLRLTADPTPLPAGMIVSVAGVSSDGTPLPIDRIQFSNGGVSLPSGAAFAKIMYIKEVIV